MPAAAMVLAVSVLTVLGCADAPSAARDSPAKPEKLADVVSPGETFRRLCPILKAL